MVVCQRSEYGYTNQGPFDSEAEAAEAARALLATGSGICAAALIGITHDDNTEWGATPAYFGTIDNHHGDTAQVQLTEFTNDVTPCTQKFNVNVAIDATRTVSCAPPVAYATDTSVTPNAIFCLYAQNSSQVAKTLGCAQCLSHLYKGDPTDVMNANVYESETDYRGAGSSPLVFARSYNSRGAKYDISDSLRTLGAGWTATYFQSLAYSSVTDAGSVVKSMYAFRPDGRVVVFNDVGAGWVAVGPDVSDVLTYQGSGYEYRLRMTPSNRMI